MRPARILLLLIAIVAGGLAAFLATRGSAPAPAPEQAAAPVVNSAQVLVAKQPVGVGQRLSAASVEWQAWPDSALRPEYITLAKSPDAATKISGTVARFEIFAGEPIRDEKLAHTDQGFLSAVLDPGMRGVSVSVSAASGSGGYIIPNDRVDVVVTDSTQGQTLSRTLLSDVKVLAIGTRLGQTGTTGSPADPADPKSQIFADTIATLELTPAQSETLINATSTGKVSLVLRSVADFAQHGPTSAAASTVDDTHTIKIIRFGRQISVAPGADQKGSGIVLNPVAFVPQVTPIVAPAVSVTTGPAAAAAVAAPVTTTVTTTTPATAAPAAAAAPAPTVK
jgi:pilus assembly protein CpaB